MQIINNVATTDDYSDALRLEQDTARSLTYIVANAPAVARFRAIPHAGGAQVSYGDEVLLSPTTNSVQNVNGVQFRSAVAGTPARIIAILTGPEDPQLAGGTPFTSTLSASGALGGGALNIPRLALASFPPLSPNNQDAYAVAIAADIEWWVVYNSSTGSWDVIGGPPLVSEAMNGAFNSAAYVDPSVLASVVVPRIGEYDVEYAADPRPAAGAVPHVAAKFGGAATADADSINPAGDPNYLSGRRLRPGLTLATNDVVKLQARTTVAGAANVRTAILRLTPRRIR